MPVSQVPSEARQLSGVPVPDLYGRLRSRPHHQPTPVLELQPISIGHGNGLGKVEEDLFAFVRYETSPPAMTFIEIESQGTHGFVLWPISGRSMDGTTQRHINT